MIIKLVVEAFNSKNKQSKIMKFTCSCCGIEQDQYPAIGYKVPLYYSWLSEEEKKNLAEITSDTCIVKEEENTYYFIRGVLVQKVTDGCQDLEYGVWVSLGQESFNDYLENGEQEDHQETYYAWFNSLLPDYGEEKMEDLKAIVRTQGKGKRPLIEIYKEQSFPSKLADDYHNGITEEEALRRIDHVLNK